MQHTLTAFLGSLQAPLAATAAIVAHSRPASCPADKPGSWLFSAAARLFGQSASRGAASLIYTAAAPELDGGLLAQGLAGCYVGGSSCHGMPALAAASICPLQTFRSLVNCHYSITLPSFSPTLQAKGAATTALHTWAPCLPTSSTAPRSRRSIRGHTAPTAAGETEAR